MDEKLLYYIGISIFGAIATSGLAWLLSARKQKLERAKLVADIAHIEIEKAAKAVSIWRETAEQLYKTSDQLYKKVDEMGNQIEDMSKLIIDLTNEVNELRSEVHLYKTGRKKAQLKED